MPGFDQKGPVGQGPMTGRQMGKCTNYGAKQKSQPTENTSQNDDLGRGFGFGRRGRGRGFGRGLGLQNRFRGNM